MATHSPPFGSALIDSKLFLVLELTFFHTQFVPFANPWIIVPEDPLSSKVLLTTEDSRHTLTLASPARTFAGLSKYRGIAGVIPLRFIMGDAPKRQRSLR